jgi:hypothetical protein
MLGVISMYEGGRGEEPAIGRSCGGLATKIHICADTHGHRIDFKTTGGEVCDCKVVQQIIELLEEAELFHYGQGDMTLRQFVIKLGKLA